MMISVAQFPGPYVTLLPVLLGGRTQGKKNGKETILTTSGCLKKEVDVHRGRRPDWEKKKKKRKVLIQLSAVMNRVPVRGQ
jgi:hypothetical protein